jgi:cell division initiation protein
MSLPTAMRGYDRAATDRLLKEIGESYEEIWLERKALREQVDQLRAEIEELRERNALAGGPAPETEGTAEETRAEAHREADAILEQAKSHAAYLLRLAGEERGRLDNAFSHSRAAIDRIRSDLSALLEDALEQLGPEEPAGGSEAERGARGELLLLDDRAEKSQRAQE